MGAGQGIGNAWYLGDMHDTRTAHPCRGRRALALPLAAGAIAALSACAPAAVDPLPQIAPFVRTRLGDSTAGWTPAEAQLLFARDSTSQALLAKVGVTLPIAGSGEPVCPGSTDSTGRAMARGTGYVLSFGLSRPVAPDTMRTFDLLRSCMSVTHGHRHGFYQGRGWTIKRRDGRWVRSGPMSVVVT